MLKAHGLIKRFGDRLAVDGMTFEVPSGQAVGLLGPNGAGKTTTMRLLTGYLPPDAGTSEILGLDVQTRALEARRRLGYLPEDNPLYEELEVSESLHYAARLRGLGDPGQRLARVKEAVRRCALKPALGKRVWELSKGFRQRLGLAQAIVHDPAVLILDEPTSGLDPNQIDEVRGLIADLKRSKTVLLSTHILAEAEASCDRVLIVHRGRIAADGPPRALKAGASRPALRVRLKAPPEDALAALAALPGAARCRADGSSIVLESESDLREAVWALAVERRWPILELAEEKTSLEAAFREITRAS